MMDSRVRKERQRRWEGRIASEGMKAAVARRGRPWYQKHR
jgi:hypothetical protein